MPGVLLTAVSGTAQEGEASFRDDQGMRPWGRVPFFAGGAWGYARVRMPEIRAWKLREAFFSRSR